MSIADASFDFATDEGSVSGSNRAFKMRASFADSDVLTVSTAMVFNCEASRNGDLSCVFGVHLFS